MTSLLQKPIRPTKTSATPRAHMPARPIKIDASVPNRNELHPLLGQTILIEGTVQRISNREGRVFLCLEDIKTYNFAQSLLPQDERVFRTLPHAWLECTKAPYVPRVAASVGVYAEVIFYKKKNGQKSYGFKSLPCVHFLSLFADFCDECLEGLTVPVEDRAISISALLMKQFNDYESTLSTGVVGNQTICYGPIGKRAGWLIVQKYMKRFHKLASKGRTERLINLLNVPREAIDRADDAFILNPLLADPTD